MINVFRKTILLALFFALAINVAAKDNYLELDDIVTDYQKHHDYQRTDSFLSDYYVEHQLDSASNIKSELAFFRFATSFYRKCCDLEWAYYLADKYVFALEENGLMVSEEYCEALLNFSFICTCMPRWEEALGYCMQAYNIAIQYEFKGELLDRISQKMYLLQILLGKESIINQEDIIVNTIDGLIANVYGSFRADALISLNKELYNIEKNTFQDLDEILYAHIFEATVIGCLKNAEYRKIDDLILHVRDFVNENNKPVSFYGYVKYAAGRMLYEQGRYDHALNSLLDAKNTFEKNMIANPCYFRNVETLSLCYMAKGNLDKAVDVINELSPIFNDPEYSSGTPLKYEFELIKAFVLTSADHISGEEAINIWCQIYDATINKIGLLGDIHNQTIELLCYVANHVGNEGLLRSLVAEVLDRDLPEQKKISLLKLLYKYKWEDSDVSIISDVSRENDFIYHKVVSDICDYSDLYRSDFWLEDASQLTLNNFLLEKFYDNDSVCKMCYNNALLMKNTHLNSNRMLKEIAIDSNDSRIQSKWDYIDSLRRAIIYSKIEGIPPEPLGVKLLEQEEMLVRGLLSKQSVCARIYTWEDVRDKLKDDEVAIEIVNYIPLDSILQNNTKFSFAALIITRESAAPVCVNIGNFFNYVAESTMACYPDIQLINMFYASPNNFYDCCWKKIEPFIKGKQKVYLSTTNFFSAVNFSCIKTDENNQIGDVIELHCLTSTNELVEKRSKTMTCTNVVALCGNAYYKSGYDSKNRLYSFVMEARQDSLGANTRNNPKYLLGTKIEIDSIYKVLSEHNVYNVYKLSGDSATEKAFRGMSGNSPRILHIATHGFKLSDPFSGKGIMKNSFSSRLRTYDINQQAMITTGLLLTKANNLEDIESYNNDGVLLSEDVANMDLRRTDLVVLSACQTGRGDIANTSGVIGLPRAFKLAGVGTIMCSLWDVDDDATALLMINFYKNFIKTGSTYSSLKEAQKIVKEQYPDPYYWAGFILLDALD